MGVQDEIERQLMQLLQGEGEDGKKGEEERKKGEEERKEEGEVQGKKVGGFFQRLQQQGAGGRGRDKQGRAAAEEQRRRKERKEAVEASLLWLLPLAHNTLQLQQERGIGCQLLRDRKMLLVQVRMAGAGGSAAAAAAAAAAGSTTARVFHVLIRL